ncbi:MAG: hypothetical protein ACI31R_03660 [Bacilli bacterium]
MRKNDNFGGREQKSLDALESSIGYVLNEMKPTLDEGLKAESVVNDSLGVINDFDVNATSSAFDNMNSSFQGQSESRAKVRVLTPNNRPAIRDTATPGNNYFDNNNNVSNDGSFVNNQNFVNSKQSGSVQSLILIYTAILVVMVVLVSLVILKFLGI